MQRDVDEDVDEDVERVEEDAERASRRCYPLGPSRTSILNNGSISTYDGRTGES